MRRSSEHATLLNRRKLLLGLGFGAANLGLLSRLGSVETIGASPSSQPDVTPTPPTVFTPETTQPPGVPAPAPTTTPSGAGPVHDVVITGGRVMDPESGFDQVANVGISDGTNTVVMGRNLEAGIQVIAGVSSRASSTSSTSSPFQQQSSQGERRGPPSPGGI